MSLSCAACQSYSVCTMSIEHGDMASNNEEEEDVSAKCLNTFPSHSTKFCEKPLTDKLNIVERLILANECGDTRFDSIRGRFVFGKCGKAKSRRKSWWFGQILDQSIEYQERHFVVYYRSGKKGAIKQSELSDFNCICLVDEKPKGRQKFSGVLGLIPDKTNKTAARKYIIDGQPMDFGTHFCRNPEDRSYEVGEFVRICTRGYSDAFGLIRCKAKKLVTISWLLTKSQIDEFDHSTSDESKAELQAASICSNRELVLTNWIGHVEWETIEGTIDVKLNTDDQNSSKYFSRFVCTCSSKKWSRDDKSVVIRFDRTWTLEKVSQTRYPFHMPALEKIRFHTTTSLIQASSDCPMSQSQSGNSNTISTDRIALSDIEVLTRKHTHEDQVIDNHSTDTDEEIRVCNKRPRLDMSKSASSVQTHDPARDLNNAGPSDDVDSENEASDDNTLFDSATETGEQHDQDSSDMAVQQEQSSADLDAALTDIMASSQRVRAALQERGEAFEAICKEISGQLNKMIASLGSRLPGDRTHSGDATSRSSSDKIEWCKAAFQALERNVEASMLYKSLSSQHVQAEITKYQDFLLSRDEALIAAELIGDQELQRALENAQCKWQDLYQAGQESQRLEERLSSSAWML